MDLEGAFYNTSDYVLLEENLGKGSFGTVYTARNLKDNKKYAAKIINTERGFDGKEQMLFLRESLILYKLNHRSIVKFKGINMKSFSDSNKLEPTILTEFLPHGSLKDNLEKEKKSIADSNWSATKKYISLIGIADAMRYLHKNGIIHRDLKPENVLMDENYYPRVCDFGLSKCFSQILTKTLELAKSGKLGTPLYMAPELLNDDDTYNSSVDVYAFSLLAYEIVTGKAPFYEYIDSENPFKLTEKIINGLRPTLTDDISKKMKQLLSRCWSEKPEERPSFAEIFDLLKSDFSYFIETVDEDEINEYIEKLEEKEEDNIKDVVLLQNILKQSENENEKLKKEINDLKMKISKYQEKDALYNVKDFDFFFGLGSLISKINDDKGNSIVINLTKSSDKGNCYSSYILGNFYKKGKFVKQNIKTAIDFFEKAAQQGNSYGLSNIGLCYFKGEAISQDYTKSLEYFQKAADIGNPVAFHYLGKQYGSGTGVEKDYSKAIEYFQKASDSGISVSLTDVGLVYMYMKEYTKAFEYLQKAASLGNPSSFYYIGKFYENGKGVEQSYSKAIEYYQIAADLEYLDSYLSLALLYDDDDCAEKDVNKAIEYYTKAGEKGSSIAYFNMAIIYENGNGVEKNMNKAIEYYEKAAELGDFQVFNNLACIYFQGKGVKKNYNKAIEYYEKAVANGDTDALIILGMLYEGGNGVKKNSIKAIEYFKKASDLGDYEALYHLGLHYENGDGIQRDVNKAIECYEKAGEAGFLYAYNKLSLIFGEGKIVKLDQKKSLEYFNKASGFHKASGLED